jgi:membrane associated rhomboid family serine protease
MQNDFLSVKYGLNEFFLRGAYWQPLTTMFIHGNFMHLAMNMVVLFQFGALIEAVRGRLFFVLLYYAGGVITSLFTYMFISVFHLNVNVVGASGAICVAIGWIANKDSFNRQGLIIAILLISFLPMLVGMNIAWYAHLIGFGVGWLIGKFSK